MKTPLLLTVLVATAAHAQWTNSYGYSFNNPISASVNQMMWDSINQKMLLKSMLRKKGGYTDAQLDAMSTDQLLAALGGAKKAAEQSKQLPAPAATKFKPTGKRVLVADLAANLTKDAEQQAVLRTVFEDGLEAYEKEAAKDGFTNDLAGAMAFFLGTAYYVSHDGQEPDDDGLTLVARQLQQALDTPDMKAVKDLDKQKLYELLVGMGTFVAVTWQSAVQSGDDALKKQMKDVADSILKSSFKLDPARVRITAAGLELAK